MKKSQKIAIIAGIGISVIITILALSIHFRLVAEEGKESGNESATQIVKEILGTENKTNSEANETPKERAEERK